MRSLSTIRPYAKNPRKNDGAVDAVAESIRQFGFRQPIVVDAQGVIVCGHTRWKAAQKLGLTEVPVHVAADLSPERVKALRIADNKTGELADWDADLLACEIAELGDMDLDCFGVDIETPTETAMRALDTSEPLPMVWILIGIETVKLPSIQSTIDSLAAMPDLIMHIAATTKNDEQEV